MEKRKLGNTEFEITRIGLGAWAMGGGGWRFAWGPQNDRESIAAIHHAVELGVNWIDTAAVYGLGHSEEVVGGAVGDLPGSARPLVFTKCSLIWDDRGNIRHSLDPDSLRRELEGSLRRLGVESIDLYQIHWARWPGEPPTPEGRLQDAWEALVREKEKGKIRYLGVSNFDVAQLEAVGAVAQVSSLQPPYSMLTRGIEKEALPYCKEHGIGVIVYSPMQSGLLSGAMTRERIAAMPEDDWRRRSPEFQEPKLSRSLELVERLRAMGEQHGRSPAEVAIAWTLRRPEVTAAIVGSRRPSQVDGTIGAGDYRLTREEIDEIDRALE